VPILLNGAYTVGVMPVDGRALGVDMLAGSGHKSMACPAPSGVLAATSAAAEGVLRTTQVETDLTKRRFGVKEVELLGCTLMGANIVVMMASLPALRRRVGSWGSEVERANHFCREFCRIEGNRVLSELPRRHCMTKVDTTATFDRVAQGHKRKGYFLTRALKDRGIVGVFPGATRTWKLSTYGLTWDQVRHLEDALLEIARECGLGVC
jgi:Sep-tRNA:Cys-tRNA synthetase